MLKGAVQKSNPAVRIPGFKSKKLQFLTSNQAYIRLYYSGSVWKFVPT